MFSNNHSEKFDYLIVSDGVFSKSKSIIFQNETNPKYFNSVALRGSMKNIVIHFCGEALAGIMNERFPALTQGNCL